MNLIYRLPKAARKVVKVSGKRIDINVNEGGLSASEKDLNYSDDINLRRSNAQARKIEFDDGMLAWLGKPKQSIYYSALENACSGETVNR